MRLIESINWGSVSPRLSCGAVEVSQWLAGSLRRRRWLLGTVAAPVLQGQEAAPSLRKEGVSTHSAYRQAGGEPTICSRGTYLIEREAFPLSIKDFVFHHTQRNLAFLKTCFFSHKGNGGKSTLFLQMSKTENIDQVCQVLGGDEGEIIQRRSRPK